MKNNVPISEFYNKVVSLLNEARNTIVSTINRTMVVTYFEIGRIIVEEEQNGNNTSEYGSNLIANLSKKLTAEFGKGFSTTNMKQMRSFYMCYQIRQTPSDEFKLGWSHYLKLMRIDNEEERKFYEIEAVKNNWSVRELARQYDTALYTRLLLSRDKKAIKQLSEKGLIVEEPTDLIKDPYILEFIGLPEQSKYSESDLEQKLIDKLEHFLLELGTGFTFVARQKRLTLDAEHFRVDLVFYNRILKCFVLIDLKIGKLKHQDIGQMQMYVNYFDREVRLKDENKTIGIILCQDKSETVVEYTLPEDNKQIFASKYQTILPSKADLEKIIQNKKQ